MKTSVIKLAAVFTAFSLVSANVVLAKNGNNGNNNGKNGNSASKNSNNVNNAVRLLLGGGGGGGNGNGNGNRNNGNNNGNGNRNLNNGNGNGNGGCNNNGNNGNGNNGNCNNGGGLGNGNGFPTNGGGNVFVRNSNDPGQVLEPAHSNYVVRPFDSFYIISLREYNTSSAAPFIAAFNGLPEESALTAGTVLQLPSVDVAGRMSPSRAPNAEELLGRATGSPVANFTTGTPGSLGSLVKNVVTTPAPVAEPPRPKVTVGSTLLVDGQSFGPQQGAARLKVAGASLKIEVVEWKADSVKIRLPNFDLESTMKADIEVVRADGSLASRTPVELSAASVVATR